MCILLSSVHCVKIFNIRPYRYMGPVAQGEALGYLLPLQERFSGITSHLELQMCDGTDPSPFIWLSIICHPSCNPSPFTILDMMTLEIKSQMPNVDSERTIYRKQNCESVWQLQMFTSLLLLHIMKQPFSSNDGSLRTLSVFYVTDDPFCAFLHF